MDSRVPLTWALAQGRGLDVLGDHVAACLRSWRASRTGSRPCVPRGRRHPAVAMGDYSQMRFQASAVQRTTLAHKHCRTPRMCCWRPAQPSGHPHFSARRLFAKPSPLRRSGGGNWPAAHRLPPHPRRCAASRKGGPASSVRRAFGGQTGAPGTTPRAAGGGHPAGPRSDRVVTPVVLCRSTSAVCLAHCAAPFDRGVCCQPRLCRVVVLGRYAVTFMPKPS